MNAGIVFHSILSVMRSWGFRLYGVVLLVVSVYGGIESSHEKLWSWYMLIAVVVLGAQLIGPEISSGTIQLFIVRPITCSSYLLSRVVGTYCVLTGAFAACAAVQIATRLGTDGSGTMSWRLLLANAAANYLEALYFVALISLFGALTRKFYNVACFGGFILGVSQGPPAMRDVVEWSGAFRPVATFVIKHPGLVSSFFVLRREILPTMSGVLLSPALIVSVVSNVTIVLFLACVAFGRREFPYGAD